MANSELLALYETLYPDTGAIIDPEALREGFIATAEEIGNGTGFTPRGPWAPSTAYAVNDIVTTGGNTYRVSTAHTSPGSFTTTNLELWAAKGTDGTGGGTIADGSITNAKLEDMEKGEMKGREIDGNGPPANLNATQVKAILELDAVNNTSDAAKPVSIAQAVAIADAGTSKAPLASPALTGTPTAPTATLGTNTTQIATTAFVIANAGTSGGASAPYYHDVIKNYNASGSRATTTGTVSSGSSTLTVADASTFIVGHGIFIFGAGASGANKVTTITAKTGNVITLASAANTAVTGAVVQHDDSAAINAAIAAAVAASGGTVFFKNGYYRCNGPFISATNSVITFPQTFGTYPTNSNPVKIKLLGETRGRLLGTDFMAYEGGVFLDFTNTTTGSGIRPAAVSTAPFVSTTGSNYAAVLKSYFIVTDEITLMLPENPTIDGLMFANALSVTIGDGTQVASKNCFVTEPTNQTVGIYMPQVLNNVMMSVKEALIIGFYRGVIPSEHTFFQGPYIAFCKKALVVGRSTHMLGGRVRLEVNATHLACEIDASEGLRPVIDMTLELERSSVSAPAWLQSVVDIEDANSLLRGVVWYNNVVGGSIAPVVVTTTGATLLAQINLYTFGASWQSIIGGGTGSVTLTAPIAKYNLSSLADSAAGSYPLTDHGTVTFSAGLIGNCANFNGTNQWLTSSLNLAGGDFTVVLWFKAPAAQAAGAHLVTQFDSGSGNKWAAYINPDNTVGFAVVASPYTGANAPGVASNGAWNCVAIKYDRAAMTGYIKLNNGSWGSSTLGGAISATGAALFSLGASANGANFFAGQIDVVRAVNSKLTDAELTALYNTEAGVE